LRIGTDGAYPPYNATTPSGELVGFEIDLIKDLCTRMHVRCEFVSVDWAGMIPKLQDGSVDIIMSALSIRAERLKVIDFSLPYFSAPTYFVTRKGSSLTYTHAPQVIDLARVDDAGKRALDELGRHLKGAVIGVEGSTTHQDFLQQYFPNAGRIRIYPKQESLFLDLVIGRIDAAFVGYANVSSFIKDQHAKGREFVMLGPGVRGGVLGEGVAFGLRKNEPQIEGRLNDALRSAGRDGTISKLSLQWFGIDGSIHYDASSSAESALSMVRTSSTASTASAASAVRTARASSTTSAVSVGAK
jgi:octopine/nopaline transport system substrate-binding protein